MHPTIKLALVGVGEIARNQHFPSIARHDGFELAAAVSRNNTADGVTTYRTIDEMLNACPQVDAVTLCQPPQARFAAAIACVEAGKHVFLEKPPGATLAEVEALMAKAEAHGVTLFASWHSRFAPAVETAKTWLKATKIRSVDIQWRESVRRWHPGQRWIWEPGGMGVFDPGINALSIFTHLMPSAVHVTSASLEVPEDCQTPIAASLRFGDAAGTEMQARFDWREEGDEVWQMAFETDAGTALLSGGGAVFSVNGEKLHEEPENEYVQLYDRFNTLVHHGESDVDLRPLTLVADAFMLAERRQTDAFHDAA
ncbi:MAG: Gfo/Idh/MocA family oxidoreductase [Pseudomonadota bacterium]